MYFLIVIALSLILILIFLIIIGKPQALDFNVAKFLDSFEKTDYEKDGRVKFDYLAWNLSEYTLKVEYWIFYKWKKNPFNWKNKISVKLDNIILPDGFDITLIENNDDFHEHTPDFEMLLTDGCKFSVKIRQIDNNVNLSLPQIINYNIIIVGLNFDIRKTIRYKFLIGEDLGNSWIAFDPGTTATTIAYEKDSREIAIAKNINGEMLTPSVLVFNREDLKTSFYGFEAIQRIGDSAKYLGFRSIKKLLGFTDTNKETGKNGKELAEKLISEIYNDIKHNI